MEYCFISDFILIPLIFKVCGKNDLCPCLNTNSFALNLVIDPLLMLTSCKVHSFDVQPTAENCENSQGKFHFIAFINSFAFLCSTLIPLPRF